MDEIDAVPSDSKYTESTQFEKKNGISVLPCCISDSKLEPQNVEKLHKIMFNTEGLERLRELILTHTDLQDLPSSFTFYLGNLIHLNLEENKLNQLPLNMGKLLKLHHLNISHNCFKALSEDIGNLIMLRTLRLESNSLNELPDSICNLMNLRQLNIANNTLRTLPNGMGKLVKLEKLNVSNNLLEDLPKSVFQLTNLCYFNAASNMLSCLSESFTHLNKLTTLNLSKNLMQEVPYCLYTGLPRVSELDLSHNYISHFSEAPNCINKLRTLKLDHNRLLTLPQWIFGGMCTCLMQLDISYNKYMKGISNEIYTSASNLKMLHVSNCALTTTSVAFLWRLESLEYLNMGNDKYINNNHVGNIFWDLPISELKNSCHLQVLIICSVGLATMPESIIQLNGLQYLDLCSNNLVWLPDAFCDLVNLMSCRLSDNNLSVLPAQLGNLEALKELILDGNKVCYLHGLSLLTMLAGPHEALFCRLLLECLPGTILRQMLNLS
jgi:Leucine-rich repeat (LRR) protein